MSFTDLMSSSRGPGLIGTLMALLVLVGFGTLYLFVIWVVGSSLLLFGVAAMFMKNQVRAIRRLAEAAEVSSLQRRSPPARNP
jgi:hypothetical protein